MFYVVIRENYLPVGPLSIHFEESSLLFYYSTLFILNLLNINILYDTILKGSDDYEGEKISDNQIRCTLTRADLADRQLQLE